MNNNNYKFRLHNFRVFDKPHDFEFNPITLLTGPNNSGKSSIVKAMLLFKDNYINEQIPLKLAFNGANNKLIDINSVLSNPTEKLLFSFDITGFEKKAQLNLYYNNGFDSDINYHGTSILDFFELNFEDTSVLKISYDSDHLLNLEDCTLDITLLKNEHSKRVKNLILNSNPSFKKAFKIDLIEKSKNYKSDNPTWFKLIHEDEKLSGMINDELVKKYSLIEKEAITRFKDLKNFINIDNENNYFNIKIRLLSFQLSRDFKSLFNDFFLFVSTAIESEIQSMVNDKLGNYKLVRTELGEHFFNFYLTEIVPNLISNSLDFLNNITCVPIQKVIDNSIIILHNKPKSFFELVSRSYINAGPFHNELKIHYLEKWLRKFELGKALNIKKFENQAANLSLLTLTNKEINISNLGYGVGQILSLMLIPFKDFADASYFDNTDSFDIEEKSNEIFYLEEPESNLHPNWHSLLIELIYELNTVFGYRFIIETHSEYIIRKTQTIVAKDKNSKDVFKILYFHRESDYQKDKDINKKRFYEIKIGNDGLLNQDFGKGFLDEAQTWKLELLSIRNNN